MTSGSSIEPTSRRIVSPGVLTGTTNIDEPWYGCTSGLVTAMRIKMFATEPFVVYHLRPLMTHSSPSFSARVTRSRGSEPAVFGSVIEKPERISPLSSGFNQRSRMSSRPVISIAAASSSAFPLSGALFPKTTGPYGDCPRISCMSPSSS